MPDKTIRKTFSALKGLPTNFKHPEGGWTVCATAEIDPSVERGGDVIRVDGMSWPGEVKLLAQHLRYAADGSPTVIGKATNFRKSTVTFDGAKTKAILADIFFADTDLAKKYKALWPEFINEVSIGAMVEDCEPLDKKAPYGGMNYTKTKGYELSVVTIPANPAAQVMRTLKETFGDALEEPKVEDKPDPAIKELLEKIASSPLCLKDEHTKLLERETKRDEKIEQLLSLVNKALTRLDDLEDSISSLPKGAAPQDERPTQQSKGLDPAKVKALLDSLL